MRKKIKIKMPVCLVLSLILSLCMMPQAAFAAGTAAMPGQTAVAPDSVPVHVEGKADSARAWTILDAVNSQRAAAGVSPLTMDSTLQKAAVQRAAEIVLYFAHTRPDGTSCTTVVSTLAGENIAAGYGSADAVMKCWMESEGHRRNILDSRYRSIGIGCVYVEGRWYYVQIFGQSYADGGYGKDADGPDPVMLDTSLKLSLLQELQYGGPDTVKAGDDTAAVYAGVRGVNAGYPYTTFELSSSLFTFISSDPKVLTVDDTGRMTAVSDGKATVTAVLKADNSLQVSHEVTADMGKPAKVTQNKLKTATGHALKVSWKKTECDGYQIRYSRSKDFKTYKTVTVKSGKTLSKTIKNLTAGKRYYVKVRAYNLDGNGKKVYGKFSNVRYLKCK